MNIRLSPKLNKENNRDYIYRILTKNILQLFLKPGENITESELCKIFSTSRTPIREALIRLSDENLLDIFPQRGSFVSKINMNFVQEAIFLRRNLEAGVLKEIIENGLEKDQTLELKKIVSFQRTISEIGGDAFEFLELDNLFHETLFRYSNKERLWSAIVSLSGHYSRLRFLETNENLNRDKIIDQHQKIIEILETKNLHFVEKMMEKHTSNVFPQLKNLKIQYPNYFK